MNGRSRSLQPPAARMPRAAEAAGLLALGGLSVALGYALSVSGGSAFLLLAAAGASLALAALVARDVSRLALVLVLLIATVPVARIEFYQVPLYLADGVAALLVVWMLVNGRAGASGATWLVAAYLAVWLPAYCFQIVTIGAPLEATYGLGRNALAVLLGLAVAAILSGDNAEPRSRRLILALAIGVAGTSLLAVAQEFAPTRVAVETFLSAASPDFAPAGYAVYPHRAFAFFTAPTTLSGFLAVAAAVLIGGLPTFSLRLRVLMIGVIVLAALGMLATYSRQWVPAAAVALLVLGLLRPSAAGRFVAVGAVVGGVAWLVLSGGALDAGYLQERFERFGLQDQNVALRLERQQTFLEVAAADPLRTVIGHGFAGQDLVARGVVDVTGAGVLREGVNDNVFLLEVFNHGIAAGLLYVAILVAVLARGIRAARRDGPHRHILEGLVAGLAAATVLHLFDGYFSEVVFMKALLWTLIGMVLALSRQQRPTGHAA